MYRSDGFFTVKAISSAKESMLKAADITGKLLVSCKHWMSIVDVIHLLHLAVVTAAMLKCGLIL